MRLFGQRNAPWNATVPVPIEWLRYVALAKQGAAEGIRAWFAESEVRGGRVDGAVGQVTAGSLRSQGLFRQSMWSLMASNGVPPVIAAGFADGTWESWKAWFDGYEITLEYPALAAVEAPFAPPTSNKPVQFSKGKSAAQDRLHAEQLAAVLERTLLPVTVPGTLGACHLFAGWLSKCFWQWHSLVHLLNVMGEGPVPSYAPPGVTKGPVVGGTLLSRRPLFTDFCLFDPTS